MSAIDDRYAELGGSNGSLGSPVEDEAYTGDDRRVRFRVFQNGAIYWILRTAPPQIYEVHGAIWHLYKTLGTYSSVLGLPLTDETEGPDGVGRFNHFAGGSIFWTPSTGAHEVHGAIHQKWSGLGLEQSPLGYPVTDETDCPDGVGRFNHFQRGSIYWTPTTGAHEVHGAIFDLWSSLNWERGLLGYPLTDESPCPDGIGRFNHFQRGSIYWTPTTGAHEVHGAIRDRWEQSGWEQGALGYPLTSEFRTLDVVGGGERLRISSFERGFLAFNEVDSSVSSQTPDPYLGLLLLIAPIYWGSEWDPAGPGLMGQSWQDVDRALTRWIDAGVGKGLTPYGVGGLLKAKSTWLNMPVPSRFRQAPRFGLPPDPSMGFTDADLTDQITAAITQNGTPTPAHEKVEPPGLPLLTSRLSCYLVFLPQGCHFTNNPWGESGHHGAWNYHDPQGGHADVADVRFAWIGQDATISKTLETAVHELVEAVNDAAGLEIGDRCQAGNATANPGNDGFDGTIDGITVRSYWSNFHNRCILPPLADPKTEQTALS